MNDRQIIRAVWQAYRWPIVLALLLAFIAGMLAGTCAAGEGWC